MGLLSEHTLQTKLAEMRLRHGTVQFLGASPQKTSNESYRESRHGRQSSVK